MDFKSLVKSNSGNVSVSWIIGIVITIALIPTVIGLYSNTSTSGWSASTIAMWGVVGVIIIAIVVQKISGSK